MVWTGVEIGTRDGEMRIQDAIFGFVVVVDSSFFFHHPHISTKSPPMPPWNAPRTKVQIKLSIQRLRTVQQKKSALAKSSRREIADLLAKGRVETCRLRVEGLIQDDIYVELLELLEVRLCVPSSGIGWANAGLLPSYISRCCKPGSTSSKHRRTSFSRTPWSKESPSPKDN